jgi:hypothetical protein
MTTPKIVELNEKDKTNFEIFNNVNTTNHGFLKRNLFKGLYSDCTVEKGVKIEDLINAIPNHNFEEWPGEEIIKEYDFGLSVLEEKFEDSFHLHLKMPLLTSYEFKEVKWKRPKEYACRYYIIKEISKKKNKPERIDIIINFVFHSLNDKSNNPFLQDILNDYRLNNILSENYLNFIKYAKKDYEFLICNSKKEEETEEDLRHKMLFNKKELVVIELGNKLSLESNKIPIVMKAAETKLVDKNDKNNK